MVIDFADTRKLKPELAKEETQTQAELSHGPEEASVIVVSSFQKVQVGSKRGLVESLSLKQLEPSHHGPFPSPLSAAHS